jgi:hypothetical protein
MCYSIGLSWTENFDSVLAQVDVIVGGVYHGERLPLRQEDSLQISDIRQEAQLYTKSVFSSLTFFSWNME